MVECLETKCLWVPVSMQSQKLINYSKNNFQFDELNVNIKKKKGRNSG